MSIYFFPLLLLFVEEAGLELFVPGDFIILFFGYHVAKGDIAYWLAFLLLFTAVMTGTTILYFLSKKYGEKIVIKLGKYIKLEEDSIKTMERRFRKYGIWALIVARHIPGLRIPTVISSGISGLPYWQFFLCSAVSVIPWILFYLSLGRRIGPRALVLLNEHHTFAVFMVVPVIIMAVGYYFLKRNLKKRK